MGVYPNSVMNMQGRDPKMSDWVIGRYVLWEYKYQLLIILQTRPKDTENQVQENTYTIQFCEICFIATEVGISVRLYSRLYDQSSKS